MKTFAIVVAAAVSMLVGCAGENGGDEDIAQVGVVVQPGPHLAADELGDRLADLGLGEHLTEAADPQLERPVLVQVLQRVVALPRRHLRPHQLEVELEP